MARMPEMQEQFPAVHGWPECRKCRSHFRQCMDGPNAGNAGAISGSAWMARMPEMQEQFPAVHGWPECRKCRSHFRHVHGWRCALESAIDLGMRNRTRERTA